MDKGIISIVPGYYGYCKPTWLNKNRFYNMADGGVSGYFKKVTKKFGVYWKTGKEFHGIIKYGTWFVQTTELK